MIFSKRINFESFSRDLAKEFWSFGKSIHKVIQFRNLRVHKNCNRKCARTRKTFYVPSGTFRGKNFGRKQNFMTFGQWTSCCRFLGRTVLAVLSYSHSMCPQKHSGTKDCFFEKNINLTLFADFDGRISGFLAKRFNNGVQTGIFVTRGALWKKFFWKIIQLYIISWFFLGNCDLQENSRFLNRHSTCPAEHFEEELSAETKIFRPLGNE